MGSIRLFSVGSLQIDAHHLLLLAAIALCLGLSLRAMKKAGVTSRGAWLFTVLSPLLGFMLAHLFYCAMNFSSTLHDRSAAAFFQFWAGRGQYMLYGAMAGVALAAWAAARTSRCSAGGVLDAIAPFGMLLIALVRLAQGLAGEGYGDYLEEDSPFARLPFAIYDDYYEEWAWALFLLAMLVALAIFLVVCGQKSRFPGDRALLALGLYACAQIILESLRRDQFLRWGFVRCSQVFSAVLALFVLLCYMRRAKGASLGKRLLGLIVFLLSMAVCLVMEFAVEQRIAWLTFLSPTACYVVSACGCAVMALCLGTARAAVPKSQPHAGA